MSPNGFLKYNLQGCVSFGPRFGPHKILLYDSIPLETMRYLYHLNRLIKQFQFVYVTTCFIVFNQIITIEQVLRFNNFLQ